MFSDVTLDQFLPFSLSHSSDKQYCFSADKPRTTPGLPPFWPPNTTEGDSVAGSPPVPAGYHNQAIFDATCQNMVLSSPVRRAGDVMISRDPQLVYNTELVLHSLFMCLKINKYYFWAIADEHQIKVPVTGVDAF